MTNRLDVSTGAGTETGSVCIIITGIMQAKDANNLADRIGQLFIDPASAYIPQTTEGTITTDVYWSDEVPEDLDPS